MRPVHTQTLTLSLTHKHVSFKDSSSFHPSSRGSPEILKQLWHIAPQIQHTTCWRSWSFHLHFPISSVGTFQQHLLPNNLKELLNRHFINTVTNEGGEQWAYFIAKDPEALRGESDLPKVTQESSGTVRKRTQVFLLPALCLTCKTTPTYQEPTFPQHKTSQ